MKIYSAPQIKAWDQYTIKEEPLSSIDLMERAAAACVAWITKQNFEKNHFAIFCGKGNNGGDGLAIGRLLLQQNFSVSFYILESENEGSLDFQTNLKRIENLNADIYYLKSAEQFPTLSSDVIIIDALFGSGLNKPLAGLAADLVQYINKQQVLIISIDVPSGMYVDQMSVRNTIIKAAYTLSFQVYKLCFMVAENAPYFGAVHLLDIGLHPHFLLKEEALFEIVDEKLIKTIFKKRPPLAHKGTFGHSLIIGGSYGKMGAAVLATSACLHSGAGLVTAYIPKCGYQIMQVSLPEAMVIIDKNENFITALPDGLSKYNAVGLGPGLGTEDATKEVVLAIMASYHKPIVVDADGLNCLSQTEGSLARLPSHSILTPHPKEFDRLFGECANDFHRISLAVQKAKELNVVIVLKGHHTLIAAPDGRAYFNNTGNAGLAKGGSGDVLTGIITSLLGQNYSSLNAALLGVYLHGLAADVAAAALSQESMTASNIICNLAAAFRQVNDL